MSPEVTCSFGARVREQGGCCEAVGVQPWKVPHTRGGSSRDSRGRHKDPHSVGRGRHHTDLCAFLRRKTFPRGKNCILVSDVQGLE